MSKEQVSSSPLPPDFYVAKKWAPNLLQFYADNKQYLPREVLEFPLYMLARAIENITIANQFIPDAACNFLKQDIDPLFSPEEFREKIYAELQRLNDVHDYDFTPLAESKLLIRNFFEQNKEYLLKYFKPDIDKIQAATDDDKFRMFAIVMQKITKSHVTQVIKLIENR